MAKKRQKKKRRPDRRRRQQQDFSYEDASDFTVFVERLRWHMMHQEFESEEAATAYMEGLLAHGGLPDFLHEPTPAERARNLVAEATESSSDRHARLLAKKALKIWPDCADAYLVLGSLAPDPSAALEQYDRGVAAAERALGRTLDEPTPDLWSTPSGLAYLLVRHMRATALWEIGERSQAVTIAREQLELDPEDSLGTRFDLLNWMLQLEHWADARVLLDRYEDRNLASWQMSRALLTYSEEGPSRSATRLLRRAYDLNPFFQPVLVDPFSVEIDDSLPMADLGMLNEALEYGARFHPLWTEDPAALAWLDQGTTGSV